MVRVQFDGSAYRWPEPMPGGGKEREEPVPERTAQHVAGDSLVLLRDCLNHLSAMHEGPPAEKMMERAPDAYGLVEAVGEIERLARQVREGLIELHGQLGRV